MERLFASFYIPLEWGEGRSFSYFAGCSTSFCTRQLRISPA